MTSAEMLIKRMPAIHQKGKEALEQYHLKHQTRTDTLVATLRDLVVAYRKDGTTEERFAAIEGVIGQQTELLDLTWVPDPWWKLVTGTSRRVRCPDRVQRRHFEVCVFSQLMWDLKSGDLYVEGGDHYADYRHQLISWSQYHQEIAAYGKQVELPTEGKAFVAHLRAWLEARARQTDATFPNEDVRIEKGEPIIRPLVKKPTPEGLVELEALLVERLQPVSILDLLMHTEKWLNWTRFFGPISGYDSKLENPVERYLTAVFCFGCNLGPSQTSRSLAAVDRRDVTWVNPGEADGTSNTTKAQEETKEEAEEDGGSPNEAFLNRRGNLRGNKCMSSTNDPKMYESLSYPTFAYSLVTVMLPCVAEGVAHNSERLSLIVPREVRNAGVDILKSPRISSDSP